MLYILMNNAIPGILSPGAGFQADMNWCFALLALWVKIMNRDLPGKR